MPSVFVFGGHYKKGDQYEFVLTSNSDGTIYFYLDTDNGYQSAKRLTEHHAYPYGVDLTTGKALMGMRGDYLLPCVRNGVGQVNYTQLAQLRENVRVMLDTSGKPLVWDALWANMKVHYLLGDGGWTLTTEEMYENQLGVLPPEYRIRGGFLVGEAYTHNQKGEAVYAAFRCVGDVYEARYMTIAEAKEYNATPVVV